MARVTRTYGPFRGFMSSVEADVVPLDRITGDSRNVVVDPLTGALGRRPGNATLYGGSAGLVQTKFSSYGRYASELVSDSLTTNGLPSVVGLLTNESTNEGCVYFRDDNASTDRTLGDDNGSGHYPYDSAGSGKAEFIMMPLKGTPSPATVEERRDLSRCKDSVQNRVIAAGSRNAIDVAGETHFPSYEATPFRWNKRFNPDGTTGNEINRVRPWGHIPPLWAPTLTGHAGTAGWDGTPASGTNKFFYSVAYLFSDGSYSMPLIPREPNAILASGIGLFTVAADYDYITWSDIPVGPHGCIARVLLRSPQTTTGYPSPADLRICGVIMNNTSTTYIDTNATDGDLALTKDDILIRFDHVWPWRARYAFTADQRIYIGYRRPNPAAMLLTQRTTSGGSTATNAKDEDSGSVSNRTCAVREDQTAATTTYLVLRENATESLIDIAGSGNTTLQGLCDRINAFAGGGGTAGKWACQLVPGTDGNAPSSSLLLTQLIIPAGYTGGTTTLTASAGKSFANVSVGMLISSPSGISARVKSKTGTTTITTDTALPGGGSAGENCTFGWDLDTVSTQGLVQAFAPSYPAVLYFSETYLDALADPAEKRRIMFTSAEPGHAPYTPNSFYTRNRRSLPDSAGDFVGGAELLNGNVLGVVCGTRGIYVLHNPRGGNTSLDSDITLRVLNASRGCISPYSIVKGDGWVGYLTADGFVVTDGVEERIISRDVYNASTSVGEWSYEIQMCVKAAAKDTDEARFHAMFYGGRLYVTYRSSSTYSGAPNRMMVYDATPGLAASGLAEITLGPNEAYGWSSPLIGYDEPTTYFRIGPMAAMRGSSGARYVGLVSLNDASTGDGQVHEFNKSSVWSDDGHDFTHFFYTKKDRLDTTKKKSPVAVRALYLKGSGTARTRMSRDIARATETTVVEYPSVAASSTPARRRVDVPVVLKSPCDVIETKTERYDTSTSADFKVWQLEVDVDLLEGSYQ